MLMDRVATSDFSTSLPSPYPSNFGDSRSEVSPSDPSSNNHQYATQPEARQSHYSTTATPTSDYSNYPASARSGSFPEHLQRQQYPSASIGGASMASNSSSLNLQDGVGHQDPQQDPQHVKSDSDVPIDPSITAQSPTQYQYPQASPYGSAAPDMSHAYGHPGVYPQGRPDWATYGHTPLTPNHNVFGHHQTTPTSATQARGNQVFSFVPIPGAQQHKRPRRRYEEIERMYKCGWNGCEKAYGTLNHLNAHVTMQSHGQKRVPEEFKEIRKEWKARKKAEEAERKAREDQAREASQAQNDVQGGHDGQQAAVPSYAPTQPHRLPPLGYQPSQYAAAPSQVSLGGNNEYSGNYIATTTTAPFPSSPYAQSHQQVYGQPNGGQQH